MLTIDAPLAFFRFARTRNSRESAVVAVVRRCCALLLAAVPAIVGSSASASAQTFVGDDGHRREHSSTYAAGYRAGRSEPHYVRAGIEMGALIAIGTGLYYLKTRDPSHGDYANVWDRFGRLKSTFDTNTFEINALGHPAAGAMYTLFARTNGLSIPASLRVLGRLVGHMGGRARAARETEHQRLHRHAGRGPSDRRGAGTSRRLLRTAPRRHLAGTTRCSVSCSDRRIVSTARSTATSAPRASCPRIASATGRDRCSRESRGASRDRAPRSAQAAHPRRPASQAESERERSPRPRATSARSRPRAARAQ